MSRDGEKRYRFNLKNRMFVKGETAHLEGMGIAEDHLKQPHSNEFTLLNSIPVHRYHKSPVCLDKGADQS